METYTIESKTDPKLYTMFEDKQTPAEKSMFKEFTYVWVDTNGWLQVNGKTERSLWRYNKDGTILLSDGRQLYVDYNGWLAVNYEGDCGNFDVNRRKFSFDDGVFTISDGRQLYICGKFSETGWMGAGAEGSGKNTDKCRRTFKMEDVKIDQSYGIYITIFPGDKI